MTLRQRVRSTPVCASRRREFSSSLVVCAVVIAFAITLPRSVFANCPNFVGAHDYAAATSPRGIAVGDFNEDGRPDIATANYSSNNVSILLANADGTFAAAVNYPAGTKPWALAVADFNGDGHLDLAVASNGSTAVSILAGNGTGSFGTAVSFAVAAPPVDIVVGDFNADGKTDIATANYINFSGNDV